MTTKKKQTKKRMKKKNPNDSTFRNINALKKRISELEDLLSRNSHLFD